MIINALTTLFILLVGFSSWAKSHQHQVQQSKVRGYIQISMEGQQRGSGDFVISADISAMQYFSDAQILWKLPDHVKVLEGEQESKKSFNAGESITVGLVVDGDTLRPGDQVFLFVQKKIDGENHGASASFVVQTESQSQLQQQKSLGKKKKKFFQ